MGLTLLVAEEPDGSRCIAAYDIAPDDGVQRPWLVTDVNIAGLEEEWERGAPILRYAPDPANGGRPPARIVPPGAPEPARGRYDPPVRLR